LLMSMFLNSTYRLISYDGGITFDISFNIVSNDSITWDGVSFELLPQNGVSDVNNAGTHGSGNPVNVITVAAKSTTNTGMWQGITIDTTKLCVADLKVSRNGVYAGKLSFILFPIVTLNFVSRGFYSSNNYFGERASITIESNGNWYQLGKMTSTQTGGSAGSRLRLTLSRMDGLSFMNRNTSAIVTQIVNTGLQFVGNSVGVAFDIGIATSAITEQDVPFKCLIDLEVELGVFIPLPTFYKTFHIPVKP